MSDRDEEPDSGSPRRALVGLALVIVLVGAVVFVMYRLNQSAKMQDCLASGRTNCAPITTPTQQ